MGTYTSYIAGTNHPRNRRAASEIRRGQELVARREPDNPHDPDAVTLLDTRGRSLGYVPTKHSRWVAERLDKDRSIRILVDDVRKEGLFWSRRVFVDLEILTGADAE